MPGDGLSFSVFVACQPHGIGTLGLFLQLGNDLLLVFVDLVDRCEVVGDIDGFVIAGQVANVAHARRDHVVGAEVLLNGLCLRRRLNDYEMFHTVPIGGGCPVFRGYSAVLWTHVVGL